MTISMKLNHSVHNVSAVSLFLLTLHTSSVPAFETNIVEQVKDIVSGRGSPNPENLHNINGTLLFRAGASGAESNVELWKSDGTPKGTVIVKDIAPAGDSFPQFLTNVNGTLFFRADDGANGDELWKSDGTAGGTVMVKDIAPAGDSFPQFLTNVNGTLYFSADATGSGLDFELWKSDGTVAGTVKVKDIAPTGNSFPNSLTQVKDMVYFSADASGSFTGFELWKSDGTANGTVMVKDINPAGSSTPQFLTNVNGTLFFRADSLGGLTNVELWKSDGTIAGTVMVKDIASGGGSFPNQLTNVNGTLFFRADDGVNGSELWKSDGTPAGTVMVKDIDTSPGGSSSPGQHTNVNGTLYFTANDGNNGRELWKSDGSGPGTMRVKDIRLGMDSSTPSNLTNVNGVLYFSADDGVTGTELYRAYVRTDTPPVFDDVPVSHPFYNAITNFAIAGYTSGCSITPSLYCPNDPVTRAQMAVFLDRGVNGQDFVPEPATGNVFDDVSINAFAAAWIETFKELEITGGCSANPPLYCPNDPITRAQIAVFLLKVIHGSAYNAPPATGTAFADVTSTDFAANWIEQLAKENVTGGCGNGNFCPNDPVTRGQMAAFLTRVFHTPQLFE